MATSGTYTFTLDVSDILEEAYENCGLELRSGYELRTARRSLNLLLTEWVNRGVNLWTLDLTTIPLSNGQATYTLSDQYVDILDAVTRDTSGTSNVDTTIERITMSEYLDYPNKETSGKPVNYTVERNATGGHTMYVWPVPDNDNYQVVGWTISYMEDVGAYTNNIDVPKRFLPALVAGLSYKIANKNRDKIALNDRIKMEQEYEMLFKLAAEEDRERASLFVHPGWVQPAGR